MILVYCFDYDRDCRLDNGAPQNTLSKTLKLPEIKTHLIHVIQHF